MKVIYYKAQEIILICINAIGGSRNYTCLNFFLALSLTFIKLFLGNKVCIFIFVNPKSVNSILFTQRVQIISSNNKIFYILKLLI